MIISISGMENAGKTTQCNTLKNNYPQIFTGIIHIKNTRYFDRENFNESWWFDPGNEELFTKAMYLCLLERIKMAKQRDGITLFDKGMDFYDLKIIAVLMIKGLSYEEAVKLQQSMKNNYIEKDGEDIKLFLESNNFKKIKLDLNNPNDVRYSKYLKLNKELLNGNMKNFIVIPHNDPELVTQQIIENIANLVGEEKWSKTKLLKR